MMSNMVLFKTVIGPVTPAMQRGWAPKTEKMKAAMKEDRRTSATPYCWVVSMRSRENAMPGSTLEFRPAKSKDDVVEEGCSLCKEYEDNCRYDSIVPCI